MADLFVPDPFKPAPLYDHNVDAETQARYPWLRSLISQAYAWFEAPDSGG